MKFSKMQAAGNDFILVNGMIEKSLNWNETAKKVCDRHFGIGADDSCFVKAVQKQILKCIIIILMVQEERCVAME